MNNKGLYICRLQSRKDGFTQEFQGSSLALQDFEAMAVKEDYKLIFHRRKNS